MNNYLIIPCIDRIEDSLTLAREYGFGFEYNDFFSPVILDDEAECTRRTDFYNSLDFHGRRTCHGDFFDVIIFSQDKLIREISRRRIIQSIEAARRLKSEAVIFHTNHSPQLKAKFYTDNWIKKNTAFWTEMCEAYPDINLYVENMFDDVPDLLAALGENLKGCSNFGVCFDYAHAVAFGKTDIDSWVTSLAPYVKHLHINDNDLKDDLHLAVGQGKIDWQQFREYYNKYFTECTVLIETGSIENQRLSAEYLEGLGLLHRV